MSFGTREDGSWGLRAILPPDEGLRVEKALEAAREAEFRTRHPEGEGSPFEISWSDALLRLADQSFDTEPKGRPAERTQVLVHLNGGSGQAHVHLGPALSGELRRLFSCDASLRWVLEDEGKPLSYGRKRRTVPSHLRTLVEERDRAVGYQGVPSGAGWWCTTSPTGRTGAGPTRTTWPACARRTTGPITWGAWASPVTPRPQRAWCSPTP